MPSRASARTSRASMSAASASSLMVVAEQMERAVDEQVRRMLVDAARLSRAASAAHTPCARMMSPSNSSRAIVVRSLKLVGFRHREGQDVGRLVLAAPMGVERADLLVAGQPHRQLDRAARTRRAAGRRFRRWRPRRPCGPAAPRSGYCPIPHRRRARSRASSPLIRSALHRPRRCARPAGGGRRRRR